MSAGVEELVRAIRFAGRVVLLAGPGLAAEAGIPPRPVSLDWSVYGQRMRDIHATAPGPGHLAARRLQDLGLLRAVVTDSDDVLFDEAGVRDVIAPAGSVELSICPVCGYNEPLGCLLELLPLPRCAACGGILQPDVTSRGDGPRADAMTRARAAVDRAPLAVVAGGPSAPIRDLSRSASAVVVIDESAGAALAAAAEELTP